MASEMFSTSEDEHDRTVDFLVAKACTHCAVFHVTPVIGLFDKT